MYIINLIFSDFLYSINRSKIWISLTVSFRSISYNIHTFVMKKSILRHNKINFDYQINLFSRYYVVI